MARTDDREVGEPAPDDDEEAYSVGTLAFTSPMPLPELTSQPGRPHFVRHRVCAPRAMTDDENRAFIADDDARFLVVTRDIERVIFGFPRRAVFTFEHVTESVTIAHPASTPDETVRHLLLDHVLPRLMVLFGGLVLHASVVATPRGAIAFVGPSGAGKSTLATQLAARGWPILSDDALPLVLSKDGLATMPMYPGVRLYPENVRALVGDVVGEPVAHYTDKRRLDARTLGAHAFTKDPVPLCRLYLLAKNDDETTEPRVRVVPIAAKDALVLLLASAFRVDVKDDRETARLFDGLTQRDVLTRCRSLSAPHRHDAIDAVQKALEEDLHAPV